MSDLIKAEIIDTIDRGLMAYLENIPHRKDAYTFLGGVWSPRLGMSMDEFDKCIKLMSIKKRDRKSVV